MHAHLVLSNENKLLLELGPCVRDPDSRSNRELGRHLVCHGGIIDGDPETCVGGIEAALPVVRPVHDDAERRIDPQPNADPLVPLLEPVGDVEMRDDRELVLKLRGFSARRTAEGGIQFHDRGADHELRARQLRDPGRVVEDGGRVVGLSSKCVGLSARRRALFVKRHAARPGLPASVQKKHRSDRESAEIPLKQSFGHRMSH